MTKVKVIFGTSDSNLTEEINKFLEAKIRKLISLQVLEHGGAVIKLKAFVGYSEEPTFTDAQLKDEALWNLTKKK